MSASAVRVWDPVVRVVHWALAALIVTELLNEASANPWHRYLGYAAGVLVAFRLTWGLIGPPYARLTSMAGRAKHAMTYLRGQRRAHAQRYAGHTPLGAVMAFALWGLTLCVAITGWMLQLDAFWGDDSLRTVHVIAAYVLAACAIAHVTGAIVASAVTRTNLVKAMVTGVKPASDRASRQ